MDTLVIVAGLKECGVDMACEALVKAGWASPSGTVDAEPYCSSEMEDLMSDDDPDNSEWRSDFFYILGVCFPKGGILKVRSLQHLRSISKMWGYGIIEPPEFAVIPWRRPDDVGPSQERLLLPHVGEKEVRSWVNEATTIMHSSGVPTCHPRYENLVTGVWRP